MKQDPEDVERRAAQYREAAKALGLSLEGLARRLNRSLSTSNRYASGKTPVPQHVLELLQRWVAEARKTHSPGRQGVSKVAEGRAYGAKSTKKKRGARR